MKWDRVITRQPGFLLAGGNMNATEKVACRIMGVRLDHSIMTKAAFELDPVEPELEGEIRSLKRWWNVPRLITAGFPATEKHYYYYAFQQTVSDGLGTPPFKRKPIGLALTYLLVIPILLWAFHRRHWVIRKLKDLHLRRAIGDAAVAPQKVRDDLERLVGPELKLLGECLQADSQTPPAIYGHKVRALGKWHLFPDSTFSRLVRIPEILAALKTRPERANCLREVEARLKTLKGNQK